MDSKIQFLFTPGETAVLVGALMTAKATLKEDLPNIPTAYKESAIMGINNVDQLLGKVEKELEKVVHKDD